MAASSWDLAWACCLAVDGRSANGLGREESAVDGAGVSKPFSLGILFKKKNENLIFAIILNTSTMYVDKAHSKRSNFS